MKALVHTEPLRLDYLDVPQPELGPDDVLVQVKACGICGSDVHGFTGSTGRRIPPIIMGHEAAGVVAGAGDAVPGDPVGARVCFDSTIYCNRCTACREGRHNRCENRQVLGVSIPGMKRHGAFAEYVALPYWCLVPMPDALSFGHAAMLEPVSIGVHAASRALYSGDDTVLVIGAGTIGLFVLQAARLRGAGRIIVADTNPHRLKVARQLGADLVVNPRETDLDAFVREQTGGAGTDIVFEVVGFTETVRQAVACSRTGGQVVLVGNLTPQVALDVPRVISSELTLLGSYASSGEYRACVDLVATEKILVQPLISEIIPLSEGAWAFERLHQGQDKLIKIILEP